MHILKPPRFSSHAEGPPQCCGRRLAEAEPVESGEAPAFGETAEAREFTGLHRCAVGAKDRRPHQPQPAQLQIFTWT